MFYSNKNTKPGFIPLSILCFVLIMGAGRFLWEFTTPEELGVMALSASSRMMNGIFGAVLTTMALIISLASNLYTPGLVKVFVRHPVVILGMSAIIGSNLLIILSNLFTPDHQYFKIVLNVCFIASCFVLASIIPFLYYLSQFLRPSYFLPMLTRKVLEAHSQLLSKGDSVKNYNQMFNYIDTISNISLTAAKRDDRQLMRLVMYMLNKCLKEMIENFSEDSPWRYEFERYVPGNSNEAKEFLKQTKTWPEAYIFSKYYHILKGTNKDQDEVINEACEHFTNTLKIALEKKNENLIEMHLMIVNRLNDAAIENKDYERIQSISQYFKEMIIILSDREESMGLAFQSWIHFANLAYEKDIHFAYETYLYDSGTLLVDFAKERENKAIEMFNSHIMDFWKDAIRDGGKHKKVTYRVAVKAYWQLVNQGFQETASLVEKTFLKDRQKHHEIIIEITRYTTPLHWSFSERLLRFNHLSNSAQKLALEYKV